jgi:hypothetical protein
MSETRQAALKAAIKNRWRKGLENNPSGIVYRRTWRRYRRVMLAAFGGLLEADEAMSEVADRYGKEWLEKLDKEAA